MVIMLSHAGELSDEAKKIAEEAIELDRLLLDYKDLMDMGRIEQAKHLNHKLVRYLNILTRVKDLGTKIEELELNAKKYDSQLQETQEEISINKNNLKETKTDLSTCQFKLSDTKRELDRLQSSTNSTQTKLRDTQSKLYSCQSSLRTLETSYTNCQSTLEDCQSQAKTPEQK